MNRKQYLILLVVTAFCALIGGGLSGWVFTARDSLARDFSLPPPPVKWALVPKDGFVFKRPDGRVVAKLTATKAGGELSLYGGTQNSMAFISTFSDDVSLGMRSSGSTNISLISSRTGGEVIINKGKVLFIGPGYSIQHPEPKARSGRSGSKKGDTEIQRDMPLQRKGGRRFRPPGPYEGSKP